MTTAKPEMNHDLPSLLCHKCRDWIVTRDGHNLFSSIDAAPVHPDTSRPLRVRACHHYPSPVIERGPGEKCRSLGCRLLAQARQWYAEHREHKLLKEARRQHQMRVERMTALLKFLFPFVTMMNERKRNQNVVG